MISRKKKGLAAAIAVMSFAGVVGTATAADAVTTVDLRPYVFGVIGVGSTDPGGVDSKLCLVTADDPITYGGKVNGAGSGTNLNVTLLDGEEFGLGNTVTVPTCVSTSVQFATIDSTGPGLGTVGIQGTKPGGFLQVQATTSLQPGILATGITHLKVEYSAGQSVKLPTGASVVSGSLSNGGLAGDVTLAMKPVLTASKPALNLAACSDEVYIIDPNDVVDPIKAPSPRAWSLDSTDPAAPDIANLAVDGNYTATIRGCAQQEISVVGKPTTSKIAVIGSGAASVALVKAVTANPQTWDGTRGKSCGASKVAGTYGDIAQSSRVLVCKGYYGDPIPFGIDVRNWVENTPGEADPYGLLHPGPEVTLLSHVFP
jgi:hypothetical protein